MKPKKLPIVIDNGSKTNTDAIACFAAGCFWSVEAAFSDVPGVIKTTVGYTDGHTNYPTYTQVCSGSTGHAEALQLEFDTIQISYSQLLEIFWQCHDPTTLNRQGADIGSQYRSAIFYHTQQQYHQAAASKIIAQKMLAKPIVTVIVAATTFYPAEDYHQHYLSKHRSKCQLSAKK